MEKGCQFSVNAPLVCYTWLNVINGSEAESLLPVFCLFSVSNNSVSRSQAIEVKDTGDDAVISCSAEYRVYTEGEYNISESLYHIFY
ncbi:hypothetical protein EB796_006046 [Bugula neritina]|uniref:Uncharacterized protein n=1 Tax=Bugula neritina TaxID=10212 RepID=A0A7J7KCR8_BUGNE|nr:hypothetical protein EB796_006046 [Bugula neritina]